MGSGSNRYKPLLMTPIRDFMARDHLFCDGIFDRAERMATGQEWDDAVTAFAQFRTLVLKHFDAEETVLFPAFEERSGMRNGPAQVMRGEHVQIRQLMEAASAALADRDREDYAGYAETLLIMVQQHNLKEENMLYPLCDQFLNDPASDVLPQLRDLLPGEET